MIFKYKGYILLSILLGSVIFGYILNISRLSNKLELFVFDTNGKSSIFIRTPEDVRVLINGGANSDVIRFLTKVLPFYSRRIDEVILTSDDGNEVSGLIDIVSRYKVGTVIAPKLTAKGLGISSSTDKIFETFIDTVSRLDVPLNKVERGDNFNFGSIKINILLPESTFSYTKSSPPEIVLRLTYGDTSFLLLGNSGLKVQKFLVNNINDHIEISSNVLIVPHSVSASSISLDLINKVKPQFVIYSELPSSRVVKSNKISPLYMILGDHRFNIKQKNTVKVLSDGKSVEVQ